MIRLAMILFSLIATTLAGSGVVLALVSGHDNLQGILVAAAIGAVMAVPVSLAVARQMTAQS